jgi:hypothetical protein
MRTLLQALQQADKLTLQKLLEAGISPNQLCDNKFPLSIRSVYISLDRT